MTLGDAFRLAVTMKRGMHRAAVRSQMLPISEEGTLGDPPQTRSRMKLLPDPAPDAGLLTGLPVEGRVSSGFGMRWHPIEKRHMPHNGIDIAAPMGAAIHATGSGEVVHAGEAGTFGQLVILDHGNGAQTYYAHMSAIHVKPGQRIAGGHVIGAVGQTGRSTAPHVHYEFRQGGVPIDPLA